MTADTLTCLTHGTSRPATVRYRIIPRRVEHPLGDDIRRALAWPGVAQPVWVAICGSRACFDQMRNLSISLLATEAIGDDAPAIRKVEE